jgi:hypothetical protein
MRRERRPSPDARPGHPPAHTRTVIAYTITRDAIGWPRPVTSTSVRPRAQGACLSRLLGKRARPVLRGDRCSNVAVLHDERRVGLLTDKLIRRGVRTSVQALERDIRAWITGWDENQALQLDQDRRRASAVTRAGRRARQAPDGDRSDSSQGRAC